MNYIHLEARENIEIRNFFQKQLMKIKRIFLLISTLSIRFIVLCIIHRSFLNNKI